MKTRPALVLLWLTLISGVVDAQVTKEKLQSQGKQRTYYLYAPASSKSSAAPALVVLLHGTDRNGLSLVEKWKDLADKEGFIIVGPDASGSGWRTPEDGPEFIHDLVEMMIKQYRVDPQRLYLFGHSAGAVFALDLAMFESNYFAAVAVHAGAWRLKQEFEFVDLAKRKIPLKIIVGDRDSFFPLDAVKATEAALKDRQFPIDVVVMKGHDHWYYDLAPEINRNAWDFLKQNSLPGERKHVQYNTVSAAGDANSLLSQINNLRLEAEKVNISIYAKEEAINLKDRVKDKVAIKEIVRAQVELLSECAKLLRDAAEVSERATNIKLAPHQKEYFSLLGLACTKRAEAFDLIRSRSELLLSDEAPNVVNPKRDELAEKANVLNDEALELEKKAEKLLKG
jgi:predicted esterase